jgi:hypothetical protein
LPKLVDSLTLPTETYWRAVACKAFQQVHFFYYAYQDYTASPVSIPDARSPFTIDKPTNSPLTELRCLRQERKRHLRPLRMLKRRLAAFWGLGSGESDPLPLRGISCNRSFVILDYAPIRVRTQKLYWKLFIIRLASECPSSRAFPLDFTSLDSHRPEHDLTAPKTKITLLNITSDFISSTSALPARAPLAPSLSISGFEHRRCIHRWSLLCLALGCCLLTLAAHLTFANTFAPHTHAISLYPPPSIHTHTPPGRDLLSAFAVI